jgi:hypothetical protein
MQPLQLIQLIRLVKLKETEGRWVYVAITDSATCQYCLGYEARIFQNTDDLDLLDIFPDFVQLSPVEVYPNVHMSLWGKETCRCRLFRMDNDDLLKGEAPNKPVMVEPKIEKPQEKPVELPKPIEPDVPTQQMKQMTDNQYDDYLTGLLSLGYITAAIYDVIMARRKKKKEDQKP